MAWLLAVGLSFQPASTGLSVPETAALAALEKTLEACEEGRRLQAETLGVERRAQGLGGDPIAYVSGPAPYLAFDFGRLKRLDPYDAALLLARERARAALRVPPEIVEGELAAAERELLFALELARADPEFSRRLREPPDPASELARAARGLALAARNPKEFFRWVEGGLTVGPRRVKLSELEEPVEGLARAREALSGFNARGGAELSRRARRWLRAPR